MHHPNSNIQSLTRSVFEIKDGLDSTTKCMLDEMEIMAEKSSSHLKCDSVVKKKEETGKAKEIRVIGSFLNRKSVNMKSVSNKPLERDEKKTLILPEPDSQVNNIYYILLCYIFYNSLYNISHYALVFRIMYI